MSRVLLAIAVTAFLFCSFKSDVQNHRIKLTKQFNIAVPEPSDIVYDSGSNHYYIVSDHGILYECDTVGKILRTAAETGADYEGVEVKGDYIYVSDESPRKVYVYKKSDLKKVAEYKIPYGGKPNSGFESIAYNYSKNCFVLVSEKDPIIIFELDQDFKIINQYPFKAANDISSARWWKGQMYLLSDEDACILRCDPLTYEVKEKFSFPILNPEGLAFNNQDEIKITSDNMQKLYFFSPLPLNK